VGIMRMIVRDDKVGWDVCEKGCCKGWVQSGADFGSKYDK